MVKENIFNGKRLFTTTVPTDYTIKRIKTHDFATSTERFLNECFRGAIELSISQDAFGYVEISVYGFAYLLKLVLSKIYGKRVLKSSLSFTRERIIFSIDFDFNAESFDFNDTVLAAKKCGLISEKIGNKLNFYANVKQSGVVSLYARDEIYTLSVYNEVFYL